MTAQPRPADQPTRDRILSDLKTTFIVEAGAGSGKTTALVGRLAALLESGRAEPEQVATVTFTRKAATELRQRIAEHFDSKLTEETPPHLVDRLTKIRQEQDRIFIGTIHSFCARLLRERPFEAGVPADFTELDEPENIALLEEAWNDFDTELHRRQDPDLERLGDVGLSLAQLRPAYLKLADYSDIGDWPTPAAAPPQVAPLRDACRAWHERIADILDQVDRQPGKCALLRHFSRVLRHARIRDLDQLVDLMEHVEYMARDKSPTKKWWPKQVDAKALQEQWQAFIADTLQPALASWQAHRYPLVMGLLRRAVAHAHQVRLRSGKLSFQDLLLGAARVLRESPSARRALQARWPFLLVDEFQDTDPIQAEVLLWLADDGRSQPRVWTQTRPRPGSLFIVGDPQQSIYRFRRADLVTYQRVKEVLQAGGSEVLHLSTSFRARPELVAWCNEVFADVYPKQPTPTMPAFQPLVAAPGATSTPVPPLVRILSAQQGKKLGAVVDDEAEEIAEYIAQDQRAHPARPLNEFLILTRKKARLTGYAQAFARRGIPFEITGGSRLNELPELRYLTQIVEAIAYPERPISLVAVLRGPMFGLSDAQLFAFARIEERFNWRHDLPSGLPPQDVPQWERAWQKLREIAGWFRSGPVLAGLERLLTAGGLVAQAALAGGGQEALEDLHKLLVLCRARRSEFTTLRGGHRLLKRWLDGQEALDGLSLPPALRPAVRIMNLHKAKGLEARVVFLSDPSGIQERLELHVDRNVEPSQGYLLVQTQSYGRSPGKTLARHPDWPRYEAIERDHLRSEEQRLLYVAATRAGQQLLISQNAGRAKSVWGFFAPHMEERPLLAALLTPAPPTEPTPAAAEPADPVPEPEAFAATWQRSLVTSEQVKPLKQWALGHVVLPLLSQRLDDPALRADHGADWGTLIHTLLEMRLREPDLPSTVVAAALLDELELSSSLVPLAVNQVETVAKSLLWRRARRAPVCLTEVPVDAVIPGTDLLVRGVIDLAFQELLGWILVDYKTDRVPRRRPRPLTEHYRPQLDAYAQVWEQVTGMNVIEYGIFWVRLGEYEPLLLR